MKKTLFSAALGAGMLLATVVPAFAVIDCSISTTGAYSTNYCRMLAAKELRLKLKNAGNVVNTISAVTSTGNSTSNLNTGGSSGVLSGDANATTNPVTTALNVNAVGITQLCDGCQPGSGSILLTGYESINKIKIDTSKTIRLGIFNEGTVLNNVSSVATTGDNHSDMNTIGGGVLTGNATASSGVSTILNQTTVNITQ